MVDIANTDSTVSSVITLPSRGHLYDGKIPGGKVAARSTTAKEEKLLYGGRGAVGEKINTLISRCLDLPEGMTPADMLVNDRTFAFIKIRMLSFGGDYPLVVRCADCTEQFNHNFDLTSLEVFRYDENEQREEPFQVKLPISGKTVGFRLLRGRDEEAIYKYEKQKKARKGRSLEDDSYTYSYSRRVVSVDGEKLDQSDALSFIENLVSQDLMELRYAIEDQERGIDLNLQIECPFCGFLNEILMPWTDQFFRPKRRPV